MLKQGLIKWKNNASLQSTQDEEMICKIEILKQVINQMLRSKTLKGFKTWKDATVVYKE